MKASALILAILLLSGAVHAAPEETPAKSPGYANTLSVEAERNLRKVAGKNSSDLSNDNERSEWARARLALIALLRLQGNEKEARKIFVGCEKVCGKHGPAEEWKAMKEWGCSLEKKANPCK